VSQLSANSIARFEKDLADLENKKRIDADKAEATALGISGTARLLRGRVCHLSRFFTISR
jgi:hypothetical protein